MKRQILHETCTENRQKHWRRFAALLAGMLPLAVLGQAQPWTFSQTGSMSTARYYHRITPLADGRVLVTGGVGAANTSAEVFNPATGSFSPTGAMSVGRNDHEATLLPNGKVLVTGGFRAASAEMWDPATGTFSSAGPISPRWYHEALLLASGKVLLVGGVDSQARPLASAELYDPVTGAFTATGSLNVPRYQHTATRLRDGRVLVVGGYQGWFSSVQATAEIYDPGTGLFSPAGSMNAARASHTATLLVDGKVLLAGGDTSGYWTPLASMEIYDPATGSFAVLPNLNGARAFHTATRLLNGHVLLAGGQTATAYLATAQVFDPATVTLSDTGGMLGTRGFHKSALLANGRVLMVGGVDGNFPLATAELYAGPGPVTGFVVGDKDSFHSGDPVDTPPRSQRVRDMVSFLGSGPGQNSGVDLDRAGANRPVGLTHYFVLPPNAKLTAAAVQFRARGEAELYNDYILFDDSSSPSESDPLCKTNPATCVRVSFGPIIAVRHLAPGGNPQGGVPFEKKLNLARAPVLKSDSGYPASPDEYRNLLPMLFDGQLDLVFVDDLTVDYSELTLTYVLPGAPAGDLDGDGKVDRRDLEIITGALNTDAYPGDPRDLNAVPDGRIDVLDARILATKCTRPGCAI